MMSAQLQQSEAAGNHNNPTTSSSSTPVSQAGAQATNPTVPVPTPAPTSLTTTTTSTSSSSNGPAASASSSSQAAATTTTTSTTTTTTAASTTAASLRNRAGDSQSPFVRAHADTLVSWQLLDDEAVDRAKKENKLIFMTIGYLASHYCHLARQDSFSNPRIASILNESFIPIVIDREERPDIDSIYMNYNHSLNNGGGWPLNLFLTPDLEPVFGGTYWVGPGVQQRAEPGGADEPLEFLVILQKLQDVWPAEEARVRSEAKQSVIDLRQYSGEGTLSGDEPDEVDLDQIEEAYTRIGGTFDPMCGGFGQEPKFPTTAKLSFLLRATRFPAQVQDVVGSHDCEYVSTMALHTLRRILLSGMHDHIGGGFHRHSVTRDWSLPSFEKMLTDNSLLLGLYLDAWLLLGGAADGEFADTVLEIADYITSSPILSEGGGFITSEAADSHHRRGDKVKRQGAYYLWTRKEFDTVIGDEQASEVAATYWDVQEHGNVDPSHDPTDEFLNQNVLRIVKNEARLAKQFGMTEYTIRALINDLKSRLRGHRRRERAQPDLDTKIVTAYNGMAIAALARTAAALSHTAASDSGSHHDLAAKARRYLDAAEGAARFVRRELWDETGGAGSKGTLYRAFSYGRRATGVEAFAEDYAFLIEGLLELHEATGGGGSPDGTWLAWARQLQERQIALFYDEPATATAAAASAVGTASPADLHARCGAFYSTQRHAPHTILRIKDAMDAAQPSANAVSASNLFRLGALLLSSSSFPGGENSNSAPGEADDGHRYTRIARQSVKAFGVEMLEHPHLFPGLLCGVVPMKLGGRAWVVVGGGGGSSGAGANGNGDAGPGAERERDARAAFHKAPRAGLFTLAFAQAPEAKPGGGGGGGIYVRELDGAFRPLTDRDLQEVVHGLGKAE